MRGFKPLTDQEWLNNVKEHVNEKDCSKYINPKTGNHVVGSKYYRRAYRIVHGPIPKGYFVCHSCDNGVWDSFGCVNPEHLFVGTQFDNMHDASVKGRLVRSKEYCAKIAIALKGKPKTESHRKNLSEASKGNKSSVGRVPTEETRTKIAEKVAKLKHCASCININLCREKHPVDGRATACSEYNHNYLRRPRTSVGRRVILDHKSLAEIISK